MKSKAVRRPAPAKKVYAPKPRKQRVKMKDVIADLSEHLEAEQAINAQLSRNLTNAQEQYTRVVVGYDALVDRVNKAESFAEHLLRQITPAKRIAP